MDNRAGWGSTDLGCMIFIDTGSIPIHVIVTHPAMLLKTKGALHRNCRVMLGSSVE